MHLIHSHGVHRNIFFWHSSKIFVTVMVLALTHAAQTFLKAVSSSASQDTAHFLWNPNVHYCDHNSSSLVPILRYTNPVHAPSHFFKIHFNIGLHLCLGLSSEIFPSGFATKILHALPFSCCPAQQSTS